MAEESKGPETPRQPEPRDYSLDPRINNILQLQALGEAEIEDLKAGRVDPTKARIIAEKRKAMYRGIELTIQIDRLDIQRGMPRRFLKLLPTLIQQAPEQQQEAPKSEGEDKPD